MPSTRQKSDFEKVNAIASRIIIADPEKFGGEESCSVQWARHFEARMAAEGKDIAEEPKPAVKVRGKKRRQLSLALEGEGVSV